MSDDDRLSRATLALYDAAMGRCRWQDALEAMLQVTRMRGAAMIIVDTKTVAIHDWAFHRIDPKLAADYATTYADIDPRKPFLARNPNTRLMYDHLHTPEAEMDRHPYYDWYQRTSGLRYYVGGVAAADESTSATLSLHRDRAAGHVQADDIALFQHLFQHFERAVQVGHRLAMTNRWNPGWEAMFADSPIGIAFIGRDGAVLRANEALRRMADTLDGFKLDAVGLHALRQGDDARLQRAIRGALVADDVGPPKGAAARIARRSGRPAYAVLTAALPRPENLFNVVAPAAVVFVTDPDCGAQLPSDRLRELYSLTPAELRLAAALAAGETLREIGDRHDLSVATLRTQLAALFRKTGTSRQAELMRLLLSTPWQVGTR